MAISAARWSPWASSPTSRVSFGLEARELECVLDPPVELDLFGATDPRTQAKPGRHLGADAHVLEHRKLGEDLGDLECTRHPERNALIRRHRRDVASVKGDGTRRRLEKPADEIEERGLAGAVRPDDGAQFAFLHSQ
jgi:hypothetical protein